MHVPYVGSGPYCYASALAMMLGGRAPSTAVIEFATGSPFGMQLIGGTMPFFDPYGWTPEAGCNTALAAMGWQSDVATGGDEGDALDRLKTALQHGPVWVGPLEMGHLHHQPGMRGPIGADHFLVVVALRDDRVTMHDPQGYPYTRLPLTDFMAAWRAETLDYGTRYTMRTRFRQVRHVGEEAIIDASLPAAIEWLSMKAGGPVAPGTLGNAEAALRLADRVAQGPGDAVREHLIHFAVRVGARRLADAATCLDRVGHADAAAIMAGQARLVGSLQHALVVDDAATTVAALGDLAPTFAALETALRRALEVAPGAPRDGRS